MSRVLNGFTPETAKNLQLDAGIFLKSVSNVQELANLIIGIKAGETFDSILPEGTTKIGATSGGGSFTAIPEIRNLMEDLDGARGTYVGGNVIDNWEIKMTTTMAEITSENLKMALCASDIKKATTEEKYDEITARNDIRDTDYIDNICWLGTQQGSDLPIVIEIKNVINMSGLNFTFADKDKGKIEVEFSANRKVENSDEVPFKIYIPTKKIV